MQVTALDVLCCFALFVCLTLLASFFVPSHLSFKNMYTVVKKGYISQHIDLLPGSRVDERIVVCGSHPFQSLKKRLKAFKTHDGERERERAWPDWHPRLHSRSVPDLSQLVQ